MKNLFIGVDFSKEKVDVAIIFADGLTSNWSSGWSRIHTESTLHFGSSAARIRGTTARDCATFSMVKAMTCGLRMPRASRMHQVSDD